MITLTIDNPEIEKVYYENFDGDNDKFIEFISQSCSANNVDYEIDAALFEKLYDEGEASGDSGYTLDEAFDMLKEKYGIS